MPTQQNNAYFNVKNTDTELFALPVDQPGLDSAGPGLLMVAEFLGVKDILVDGWLMLGGDCQGEEEGETQPSLREAPGNWGRQHIARLRCCTVGGSFAPGLSWWLAGSQGKCAEG